MDREIQRSRGNYNAMCSGVLRAGYLAKITFLP